MISYLLPEDVQSACTINFFLRQFSRINISLNPHNEYHLFTSSQSERKLNSNFTAGFESEKIERQRLDQKYFINEK